MCRFYLSFCFLIVSCSRDFSLLTIINFELNGTTERMLLNFRHVQFESLLRGRSNAIFFLYVVYVICFRLQEVGSEDRICENLNLINPQESRSLYIYKSVIMKLVPSSPSTYLIVFLNGRWNKYTIQNTIQFLLYFIM